MLLETIFFVIHTDKCALSRELARVPSSSLFKGIKGIVQRDFRLLVFSSFQLVWATDQWVKIFSNLVLFSLIYSKFSTEKTDSAQFCTLLRGTFTTHFND